jgi:hypothetical protein
MSEPAIIKVKIRTGTLTEWQDANPVLLEGEFGFITDDLQVIIGDGTNTFLTLIDSFHRDNQLATIQYVETQIGGFYTAIGNEANARIDADELLQDAIDTIELDITTIEGNVSTLQSDVSTLQGLLTALDLTLTAKGQILILDEVTGQYTPLQVGTDGQVLTANSSLSNGVEWSDIPAQSIALDDITDVNIGSLYSLNDGDLLKYDSAHSEWVNAPSNYGDMFKSTYDTNDDGIVDSADTSNSTKQMLTIGRNSTGVTLYKGTIVYISGSTGNRPNFVKARGNSEGTSAGTFGVIVSDIANNSDGYACTIGTISNLDTRSTAPNPFTSDTLVDGDTIYLSPTTAGYVTNVKPYAPNHLVYIGKVVVTSPTNGTIVYRIANGYELDELHDVQAQSPTNKDVLYFDSAVTQWKTSQVENLIGVKQTSFAQFRKAGRWYNNGLFPPANANFTNQLAIRYVPFYLDADITISRIGINVVTIAPASSTCRVGIYNNDASTCQPSTRIVDAGTMALDSTGAKSITGLSVALTKGLYWLAYVGSANSGTITGIGTSAVLDVKGQANIGAVGFAGFNQTFTYAPLPASAGTLTEVNSGGTICIFYYY